jgi:hypothetical protein
LVEGKTVRWLLHKLFGTVFVALEDFDGEVVVRRVRFIGPLRIVHRIGRLAVVKLLPGGRVTGSSFVSRWYPLLGDPRVQATERPAPVLTLASRR